MCVNWSFELLKNLTFHDTNKYKNDKTCPCAASIFNETHFFLKWIQLAYLYGKKKGGKSLGSSNYFGDTEFNE